MNCPHCNRVIYSRQHKNCGYCGEELPPELLLSPSETKELKQEMIEIEQRRVEMKEKEAKEKEEQRKKNASDSGFGFSDWLG